MQVLLGSFETISKRDGFFYVICIQALKNHQVYQIPAYPFDWFDRPPGVNRVIGIRWLANLLYPNIFKLDIKNDLSLLLRKL